MCLVVLAILLDKDPNKFINIRITSKYYVLFQSPIVAINNRDFSESRGAFFLKIGKLTALLKLSHMSYICGS